VLLLVFMHVFLFVLLILPVWSGAELVLPTGAGGPGPSGGGGGGNGGTNGSGSPAPSADAGERLHYVSVAPTPPQPAERAIPREKPEAVREPEVTPPKPVLKEPLQEIKPVAEPQPVAVAPGAASIPQLAMSGTGTGDSGSAGGAGPGSGGGTGSGTGTGRGSGSGSGRGGGEGEIYPATPDFLVMPALQRNADRRTVVLAPAMLVDGDVRQGHHQSLSARVSATRGHPKK
jgi:protein TonB